MGYIYIIKSYVRFRHDTWRLRSRIFVRNRGVHTLRRRLCRWRWGASRRQGWRQWQGAIQGGEEDGQQTEQEGELCGDTWAVRPGNCNGPWYEECLNSKPEALIGLVRQQEAVVECVVDAHQRVAHQRRCSGLRSPEARFSSSSVKMVFVYFFLLSLYFIYSLLFCFWRQFTNAKQSLTGVVRASVVSLATDLFEASCSRPLPFSCWIFLTFLL